MDDLLKLLSDVCGNEEVLYNKDMDLESIMDSLAFLNLILELELQYDIEIQPTRVSMEVWKTPQNIYDYIYSL